MNEENSIAKSTEIVKDNNLILSEQTLIPPQLTELCSNSTSILRYTKIYYISDMHLETWYEEYIKQCVDTPLSVVNWIFTVVENLFSGDFLQDIEYHMSIFVLFLGDIADSFEWSKLFYSAFVARWDSVYDNQNIQYKRHRKIYAVLGNHEINGFLQSTTTSNKNSAYKNGIKKIPGYV